MNTIDLIGFVGVSLILIAFFLNLVNVVTNKSLLYILLNFVGAATACYASILLKYVPFIILEGIWAFISILGLFNLNNKKI